MAFLLQSLLRIPQPAVFGDVDDDAVGTAQLDLSLAGALASASLVAPFCRREGRQPGGPRLLHPVSAFRHVVDDEADVVNAAEIFPLISHVWVIALLAGPDGQVQVTIAEVDVGAATPPNLSHAKHVFVEGGDLLQVVGGQGNMLDFRHARSPQDAPILGCSVAMARLGNTWRLAMAASGRSIACGSEDRQTRFLACVAAPSVRKWGLRLEFIIGRTVPWRDCVGAGPSGPSPYRGEPHGRVYSQPQRMGA